MKSLDIKMCISEALAVVGYFYKAGKKKKKQQQPTNKQTTKQFKTKQKTVEKTPLSFFSYQVFSNCTICKLPSIVPQLLSTRPCFLSSVGGD